MTCTLGGSGPFAGQKTMAGSRAALNAAAGTDPVADPAPAGAQPSAGRPSMLTALRSARYSAS